MPRQRTRMWCEIRSANEKCGDISFSPAAVNVYIKGNDIINFIFFKYSGLELVSKELNHLAAILHVYAGVWIL